MSRETFADRYGIETIWKSASGTAHIEENCYRLQAHERTRANDVPADTVPVGHYDRCPSCWDDLDDPTNGPSLTDTDEPTA